MRDYEEIRLESCLGEYELQEINSELYDILLMTRVTIYSVRS